MARPKSIAPRDSFANVRLTTEEREEIEATARTLGLRSISEYVRHLHKFHASSAAQNRTFYETAPEAMHNAARLRLFRETHHGEIYLGDGLDYLHAKATEKSIDLIVTSPPFGLVRKKSYGNEDAEGVNLQAEPWNRKRRVGKRPNEGVHRGRGLTPATRVG